MTHFEIAHKFTAKWEGGYVDHPADPGGVTNHGISLRFLRAIGHDVDGDGDIDADDIRTLTASQAADLFKRHFWDSQLLDAPPLPVAVAHYDCSVNTGIGRAVRILQQACNFYPGPCLIIDGSIGPKTRARVLDIVTGVGSAPTLALRMTSLRRAFYDSLVAKNPSLAVFRKGWMNRVKALETYLGGLSYADQN